MVEPVKMVTMKEKRPCTEDTVGTEWLKAPHKAFKGSTFAHEVAKISKEPGTDFLATQLHSVPDACFHSTTNYLFVIFASFCADSLLCDGRTPEANPSKRFAGSDTANMINLD